MPGKLQVIVGGQFGSEAKGAVAGHLARHEGASLLAMRVGGPNAGHSAIDNDGRVWRLRQIPAAAVTNPEAKLAIGAGSEIDYPVLAQELADLSEAGISTISRLYVDQSATLLDDRHKAEEVALVDRIGSTGKGVGAARADRIGRVAELYGGDTDTTQLAQAWLASGGTVQVEGTQGYGLGLHTQYYPHCTSSDCRAVDFLSMAGISPWAVDHLEVWVVFRTYPIRVAGNSGVLKNELSWEELSRRSSGHVQTELTTVTQKVRRVGEWDSELARAALAANGYPSDSLRVALTHLDYLFPDLAGRYDWEMIEDSRVQSYLAKTEIELGQPIDLVGTGPDSYMEVLH